MRSPTSTKSVCNVPSYFRQGTELFLISLLLLFLELACIRWFPAHVLFLTFFTNMVLLACFLGMSVGCLAAKHRRNYLVWTPLLLGIAMGAGLTVESLRTSFRPVLDAQASPQVVFFGAEDNNPGDDDISNSKSEIRNPKQIQNTKSQIPNQAEDEVSRIGVWDFEFVSDFGFRISNFESAGVPHCRPDAGILDDGFL